VQSGFERSFEGVIAAVGAVGNVGKAERFFAKLFPSTSWKSSRKKLAARPTFFDFHRVRHFPQPAPPGEFFGNCGKESEDTPSPLRINLTNR